MVEFDEFLSIMKNGRMNVGQNGGVAAIYEFFKKLSRHEIGIKGMSFPLLIGQQRRKKILDSMMGS